MGYQREGHFERIGPIALDVEITTDEADYLRHIAVSEIPLRHTDGLIIDDTSTQIRTGTRVTGVISDALGDYRLTEEQLFAKTIYSEELDSWWSILHWTRFRDSQRDTKITHRFETTVMQGDVIGARRRIYIARDISRIAIENGQPTVAHLAPRQYKMYERPTTSEDIDEIGVKVRRTVARASITGGNKKQ